MKRTFFVTSLFILILGLPVVVLAQQKVTIQGRVQYLESAALPPNATLYLTLLDADTRAELISREKEGIIGGKTQPFPITMELDASRVVAGARYRVVAEITDTEQSSSRIFLGQSAPFSIASSGTTTVPQFRAYDQPGTLGTYSAGSIRLAIALGFVVLAGLIALLRRKRAQSMVQQAA